MLELNHNKGRGWLWKAEKEDPLASHYGGEAPGIGLVS
jgi:hypothetical protein